MNSRRKRECHESHDLVAIFIVRRAVFFFFIHHRPPLPRVSGWWPLLRLLTERRPAALKDDVFFS